MTRLKALALSAIGFIIALAALGFFASVGLVGLGIVAVLVVAAGIMGFALSLKNPQTAAAQDT